MQAPIGSKIKFETNFGPRVGHVLSILKDGQYLVEAKVLDEPRKFHVHPDCILWWSERRETALPNHPEKKATTRKSSISAPKGASVAEMLRRMKFSEEQA